MRSENKNTSFAPFFMLGAFLLTLCGIILRIVNISLFYDADIGYFKKAPLPSVMYVFFLLVVVAFAVACVVLEKKELLKTDFNNPLYFKILMVICAIGSFSAAMTVISSGNLGTANLLLVLAALGSAVYFALYFAKKLSSLNTLLALFPAFACLMILGLTYFDVYTQMNAPHKVLIHLASIACMFGSLSEARAIAEGNKRRMYFFSLSLAIFFTGVSSVPTVILYFSNSFEYSYIDYDCILLVFFVYFVARGVTHCIKSRKNVPESVINEEEKTFENNIEA